jgi:putative chitinase
LILAIAHKESGFNPDAAAGTSSATGLGQFTNDTRKKYRLDDSNMWDMDAQADTMIKLTMDNARLAKKRLRGPEYVYKYHHDGPNKRESNDLDSKSEGMDISRSEIMPRAKTFLKILRGE